jgi:hypothetical protein
MASQHSTLIGGSSCERVMNCTGSVKLSEGMPDSPSQYADEGTMLHSVMEQILEHDLTPEQMIGYAELGHVLTEEHVEEAIIPALETFKQVTKDFGSFEYVTEARVQYQDLDAFGTVDVLGSNAEYTFVIDWKFGVGVGVSAISNSQLCFYAGAGRETSEFSDMFSHDLKIVLVIIQPRARDGEPYTYDVIGYDDLNEFVERMKAATHAVLNNETTLNPGPWCRWCKAAPICSAKKSMAEELISREFKKPPIDADELGLLVGLANQMADWSKSVHRFAYEELGRGHSITGYKLVQKRTSRKWTDPQSVEQVFETLNLELQDYTKSNLISPAQAEKMLKAKKLNFDGLSDLIVTASVGTTMAEESDKRPAVIKLGVRSLNLPPNLNLTTEGTVG